LTVLESATLRCAYLPSRREIKGSLITLENVNVGYPKRKNVLEGVNLVIHPGSRISISFWISDIDVLQGDQAAFDLRRLIQLPDRFPLAVINHNLLSTRAVKSRQKKLDDRWGLEKSAKGTRFKLNRDLAGYFLTANRHSLLWPSSCLP
jgi:hypothetical protein